MRRVVVLTRGLPLHHAGGMESVAWDLARELARTAPVTVLTTSLPGRAEFELDGVRVRALPGTPPGRYSAAWWRGSRAALAAELSDGSVAGVLSVSAGAFSGVDLAAGRGARTVLQAHGTSVMELTSKLTSRRLRPVLSSVRNVHGLLRDVATYRRFDTVAAIGPSVERSLTRPPLGRLVAMPPVHLLPNGIDTARFHPDPAAAARVRRELAVPEGSPLLLVAGRLHPQKRVDRSVQLLTGSGAVLVLAGDGPERAPLQRLAAELGVDDRVRFLGAVERGRLPALYAAADVSLLTSQWREGLPMAVLESLACGTPVVTSLTTAPVEGAGDAVTRADATSPRALAATVGDVLERGRSTVPLLPPGYDLASVARRYAVLLGAG
ncbi:glycosyl transferase group 1 [Kineococcus radiotolerans SRS30216 = ATCC BAA-149]|uniref:Glycosyl transferase group 1 n=1 Tax=Kineococcus radiotolerans (strain ATCC BAA-149 / DSM 14245 / SRS30216) TaxID=266940 RepID=A6W3W9_KINRD|nr:glycosyl transferase group 1 [Kineococcus radiotolerans SRS30216 = ATCC BAA-149]